MCKVLSYIRAMSLRQRPRKQLFPRRLILRSQVRSLPDPMDPQNFYGEESPLTFRMRRPLRIDDIRRRRIVIDDLEPEGTPKRECPKTPVYKTAASQHDCN